MPYFINSGCDFVYPTFFFSLLSECLGLCSNPVSDCFTFIQQFRECLHTNLTKKVFFIPTMNNLPVNLPPLPPRAQACLNNIQMGFKMGAAVGGTFGLLAGGYSAIANRSFWLFPLGIIGGAASFGFFLGCGMIIRCDESNFSKSVRALGLVEERTM